MADARVYLGRSIYLPLRLLKGRGVIADGLRSVEQSILSILTTPVNSRFFLRSYGSKLEELIFEPNDKVLESLLRTYVFEALETWETRAEFTDVEIAFPKDSQVRVDITITYRILPSNEINSFIYPFYRKLVT